MARAKEPWYNDSTSPEDRRLKLLILDVPSKSLATPILTFSISRQQFLNSMGRGQSKEFYWHSMNNSFEYYFFNVFFFPHWGFKKGQLAWENRFGQDSNYSSLLWFYNHQVNFPWVMTTPFFLSSFCVGGHAVLELDIRVLPKTGRDEAFLVSLALWLGSCTIQWLYSQTRCSSCFNNILWSFL